MSDYTKEGKDEERDFREVAEWDWVQIGGAGATMLHAPDILVGPDDLAPVGGMGWTVCGRSGRLGIPGFGSRMLEPRCKQCCRRLGWPQGVGSPKNDPALRPLVASRLAAAALAAPAQGEEAPRGE